jgi:murein DD-endopeptidase MepM/ murein hydrolase activator NlpD
MRAHALGEWLTVLALGFASAAVAAPPAAIEPRAEPAHSPSHAETPQQTRLSLPFAGVWVVGQGYHGSETHSGYAAYALDLVRLGRHGRAYIRSGKRNRDWSSFGAPVLATAAGVVVRAVDHYPDNRILGPATAGNTVIIEHQRAEFSEYVHLQRGSLWVRLGERVRRGQPLARAGNSGAQTPHLHWAFLSSIDPIRTRPAVFSDYELRDAQGAWRAASGTPRSGDVIRPRAD